MLLTHAGRMLKLPLQKILLLSTILSQYVFNLLFVIINYLLIIMKKDLIVLILFVDWSYTDCGIRERFYKLLR